MPRGTPLRQSLAPVARHLRDEGWKYREIAEHLGVAFSTAHDWCSDPDRAKHKARRMKYAGTCLECGAPTDGSYGPGRASKRCAACQLAKLVEETYAASELLRKEIETLWNEGLPVADIAKQIGWTTRSAHSFICQIRRQGADVPYRRKPTRMGNLKQKRSGREAVKRLHGERMAA